MANDLSDIATTLVVGPEEGGVRLDLFLARHVPGVSRSQIQRAIRLDLVDIDGVTAWKTGIFLREGQEIAFQSAPTLPSRAEPEDIPLDILFEDEHLVVVNKAAGMVVHPAAGHPGGTLVNALLGHFPALGRLGPLRPGLVHRLDRGTSGAIVVAKTAQARESLAEQFLRRSVFKGYLAFVLGVGLSDSGAAERPIDRHRQDRKRFTSLSGSGRPSSTLWKVLGSCQGLSLVTVRILTGRTHQIRVHLADEGFPVAGDDLYDPGWRRKVKNQTIAGLLECGPMLHAWVLQLTHPATQSPLAFAAPLPPRFLQLLDMILPDALPQYQSEIGDRTSQILSLLPGAPLRDKSKIENRKSQIDGGAS